MHATKELAHRTVLVCACSLAVLPGAVSAQEAPRGEERVIIKIFSLSHAAAAEMCDVVNEVFGDALVGIAADKRTNSLVVRARANVAEELEALVTALDAELKLKTTQMATLEQQIAKCRIAAPGSGVVRLSQPSLIREGAIVRQGQPLMYLEPEAPPSR